MVQELARLVKVKVVSKKCIYASSVGVLYVQGCNSKFFLSAIFFLIFSENS